MTILIVAGIALVFLLFSFIKSIKKTTEGLKIAKNMMVGTFIEVAGIMALVGLLLAFLPPHLIKQLLGNANTVLSTFFGAIVGTVTIMPAIIAFPLSKSLYASGAHLVAIAAFLTTLTMVGVATLPIEIKHFGKRFAIVRNFMSFLAALFIAFAMGMLL